MNIFSKLGKNAVCLFVSGLVFLGSQTTFAQETTTFGANFSDETAVVETKSDAPVVEMRLDLSGQISPVESVHEITRRTEDFAYRFNEAGRADDVADRLKKSFDKKWESKEFDFAAANKTAGVETDKPGSTTLIKVGFNYRGAFTQSLVFLAVQHGYAIGFQEKTREALRHGPFWGDYGNSVKNLRGWDDGGRFFTNYIAHPMQGALTGHIYVQNSPQASREKFSMSAQYWKTRAKALLWTTAWSTQFEIGPISQASIGNVGLKGKQTWEDIIVTPTMGTAMLVAEDAVDRYIIERVERNNNNFYVKVFLRMLLNPTRNFSNMLRLKEPWYRDR